MLTLLLKAVALALGLLLLKEFQLAMASIRAERWPSKDGTLMTSPTLASNELTYEFSVEGETYRSSTIGFGFPTIGSRLITGQTLSTILASAPKVPVHYDSRNPDMSVLVCGFQGFHAIRIGAVFVLFVAACLFAFL